MKNVVPHCSAELQSNATGRKHTTFTASIYLSKPYSATEDQYQCQVSPHTGTITFIINTKINYDFKLNGASKQQSTVCCIMLKQQKQNDIEQQQDRMVSYESSSNRNQLQTCATMGENRRKSNESKDLPLSAMSLCLTGCRATTVDSCQCKELFQGASISHHKV